MLRKHPVHCFSSDSQKAVNKLCASQKPITIWLMRNTKPNPLRHITVEVLGMTGICVVQKDHLVNLCLFAMLRLPFPKGPLHQPLT